MKKKLIDSNATRSRGRHFVNFRQVRYEMAAEFVRGYFARKLAALQLYIPTCPMHRKCMRWICFFHVFSRRGPRPRSPLFGESKRGQMSAVTNCTRFDSEYVTKCSSKWYVEFYILFVVFKSIFSNIFILVSIWWIVSVMDWIFCLFECIYAFSNFRFSAVQPRTDYVWKDMQPLSRFLK